MREISRNVLVLGDNDLASLAIVRSMGRAGLKVHLAAWEERLLTRASRYVSRILRLGDPLVDPDAFAAAVLREVQGTAYDLVIPVSDKSLVALMPHASVLAERTVFAAPDARGYFVTHDKAETLQIAQRCGLAVPRSVLVSRRDQLKGLALPGAFPLVLKPVSSVLQGQTSRNEVRIARSEDELRQRLPAMMDRAPVLVQAFCPGRGMGLDVLSVRGEIVAAFQHERVHEPPEGGPSSYRKSAPLDPDLLRAAGSFCAELRFTGPAMFEFKVDPASMAAVLMEVNGRFWGSLALSIQAGVDFPLLLYECLVLGNEVRVFDYKIPFFVRHTMRDVQWLVKNFRAPANRPEIIKVKLKDLLKEPLNFFLFREGYDIESLTDPLPAVVAWSQLLLNALRKCKERALMGWMRGRCAWLKRRIRTGGLIVQEMRRASSVLFLCYGNIHRSPFAAKCFERLLRGGSVPRVRSAGFHGRENRSPSDLSIQVAHEQGIDLSAHQSKCATAAMIEEAQLIFVMEVGHLVMLGKMDPRALSKAVLLSAFDREDDRLDIEDPYGKGRAVYQEVFRRIRRSVDGLGALLGRSDPAGDNPGPAPGHAS